MSLVEVAIKFRIHRLVTGSNPTTGLESKVWNTFMGELNNCFNLNCEVIGCNPLPDDTGAYRLQ